MTNAKKLMIACAALAMSFGAIITPASALPFFHHHHHHHHHFHHRR
jgi:hypothetical protein